jgi:SNF2 family DNA or RNA helicase
MTDVKEILKLGEEKNVEYMSAVAMAWYYSALSSLNSEKKQALKKQIMGSSKIKQFLKNSFYYFDYLPLELGNKTFEKYDRTPFIFAFDKVGDTSHGINLNYVPIRDRIMLMNKIMLYVVGDYNSPSDLASRIALDYNIMKNKSTFYEQNIIYRKYLISRGKNYRLIPIKYAKIFGCLNNVSDFPISESVIHRAFLREKGKYTIKETKKRKKTI